MAEMNHVCNAKRGQIAVKEMNKMQITKREQRSGKEHVTVDKKE